MADPLVYQGVEIFVVDESSHMTTGTYKDLDASLVMAIISRLGLDSVVLSSAGNLGCALATYARHLGCTVYFFHPSTTQHKLAASNINWESTRSICVDRAEQDVKEVALRFSERYGILHVPDIRWRLASSALRAMYILECSKKLDGIGFIGQAMCAGFGPAGIYNACSELIREGRLKRSDVPRFLGFQQEANAPMVRAWKTGEREIADRHVSFDPQKYVEPGLYNTNPGRNYTRLHDLLRSFGGELTMVSNADFDRHAPRLIEWFEGAGKTFTRIPGTNDILEKTGLLTGVGICKAIDEGLVLPGERVLYLLTGGFRKIDGERNEPLETYRRVDESREVGAWVAELGEELGLKPIPHVRKTDRMRL